MQKAKRFARLSARSGSAESNSLRQPTGMPLTEMERLVVGCQINSDGNWQTTFVVRASKPITSESLLAKFAGAAEKEHGGKKYWLADERAYYLPGGNDDDVLVVAPEDAISDVIDLAGQPPPLRRDIERLIDHTDARSPSDDRRRTEFAVQRRPKHLQRPDFAAPRTAVLVLGRRAERQPR